MTLAAVESSGVALWRRIADDIERAIAAGTYQAGSRLPGEVEIAERFGVNRHTVRRALAALAERGIVRAERGSGTYVEARRIPYPIGARTRFSENVGSSGHEAGGRLIAHAVEEADEKIANALALKPGAPVVRLDFLRHADRVPVCVSTAWLPADRFADAARVFKTTRSITRTLAHCGVADYRRASTRIVAALVDAADAMWLKLGPGAPVLVVDSVNVDPRGRPVMTSRTRFAAERIEFVVGD